ncbi:MAG: hypothetical protein LBF97_05390 [Elusimicrobiota bacterium]|jgi:hypothetical protein|nr:hypothetical protein [Elusimicrobiota bacterium]
MDFDKILEKDIATFGEDVTYEVYSNLAKLLYKTDSLTEDEKKIYEEDVLTEVTGKGGVLSSIWNFVKGIFGKKNPDSTVVANVISPTQAAAEATAVTGGGLLSKIKNIIGNGGIASIFDPTNLPRVLAVAGGAALVGWILKKIFSKKNYQMQYEEYRDLYNDILKLEEVKIINEIIEESIEDIKLRVVSSKTHKEFYIKSGEGFIEVIRFTYNKNDEKWIYDRYSDNKNTDVRYNGAPLRSKGIVKNGDRLYIPNKQRGPETFVIHVPEIREVYTYKQPSKKYPKTLKEAILHYNYIVLK